MLVFLINPGKQLNQAKDSQRKQDFKSIRNALDAYYNDFNCYPESVPFGEEWRVAETIYMKQTPEDQECGNSGSLCYSYVVENNTTCPQWNVLFGRLAVAPLPAVPACLLDTACLPANYTESGYNLCDYGGNIDCSMIQNEMLPVVDPIHDPDTSPTPTGGGPGLSSTPSPTIDVVPPDGIFYCGCGNNHVTVCNVTFTIPTGIPYYPNSSCNNQCGQPC